MYNDPTQANQPDGQPPRPYEPPPAYGQPGPQSTQYPPQQPYPPYQQPQYGGPPPFGAYPPQPPQKKSLRWLWITLGIVGGVIVLGCIGCGITFALGIGFFAKTILGPSTTANAYYQAIKNQDYTHAYSYIDTGSIPAQAQTEQAFTLLAQTADRLKGPVSSFSQTNIQVNNNTATVTMSVTRNGSPYTVQLQLTQIGNTWKISGFDNI